MLSDFLKLDDLKNYLGDGSNLQLIHNDIVDILFAGVPEKGVHESWTRILRCCSVFMTVLTIENGACVPWNPDAVLQSAIDPQQAWGSRTVLSTEELVALGSA